MKFREHRGSLDASMMTCVEIEPTEKALRAHLVKIRHSSSSIQNTLVGRLEVEPYGVDEAPLPDPRINWSATYVVTENGNAIGFTNEPLQVDYQSATSKVCVERKTFLNGGISVDEQLQTKLQILIDEGKTLISLQQVDVHYASPNASDTYIIKATFLVVYI